MKLQLLSRQIPFLTDSQKKEVEGVSEFVGLFWALQNSKISWVLQKARMAWTLQESKADLMEVVPNSLTLKVVL